jgi:hypothetical protein
MYIYVYKHYYKTALYRGFAHCICAFRLRRRRNTNESNMHSRFGVILGNRVLLCRVPIRLLAATNCSSKETHLLPDCDKIRQFRCTYVIILWFPEHVVNNNNNIYKRAIYGARYRTATGVRDIINIDAFYWAYNAYNMLIIILWLCVIVSVATVRLLNADCSMRMLF